MRDHDEVFRSVKRKTEKYNAGKRGKVAAAAFLAVLLLVVAGVSIPSITGRGTENNVPTPSSASSQGGTSPAPTSPYEKKPPVIICDHFRSFENLPFKLPKKTAIAEEGGYVINNFSEKEYEEYHQSLIDAGFTHKGGMYFDLYDKEGCLILIRYNARYKKLTIDWRARSKYAPENGISEAEAAKIIAPADTYSPIPIYAVDVTPERFYEATGGQLFAFADYSFDDPRYSTDVYGKKSLSPYNEHYTLRIYFVRNGRAYRSEYSKIAAGDIDNDGEDEVYLLNYGPTSGRFSFALTVVDGEEEYDFWYFPYDGMSPSTLDLAEHEGRVTLKNGGKYFDIAYEDAVKGYYVDGKFDRCEKIRIVAVSGNDISFGCSFAKDPYAAIGSYNDYAELLTPAPEPDESITAFGTVSKDIMAASGIKARSPYLTAPEEETYTKATEFAIKLLLNCYDGENTLVSPLSVSSSLGMLAVGAKGNTLAQMEKVLGMTGDEITRYISKVMNARGEQDKLMVAGSLWLRNTYPISGLNRNFLYSNVDHYKAAVYSTPFSDTSLSDISKWINEATGGKLSGTAGSLPQNASMFAAGVVALDAKWRNGYQDNMISTGTFTNSAGEKKNVTYLTSWEKDYVFDSSADGRRKYAEGFMKYYDGEKYAFVALMPSEGTSLDDYILTLDGAKLRKILKRGYGLNVNATIPAFDADYSLQFNDVLKKMGMTDAFDPQKADFSGIGTFDDGAAYLNEILHGVSLSYGIEGTSDGVSARPEKEPDGEHGEPDTIYIRFDRPFLYMVIDMETIVPVLIGTVTDF